MKELFKDTKFRLLFIALVIGIFMVNPLPANSIDSHTKGVITNYLESKPPSVPQFPDRSKHVEELKRKEEEQAKARAQTPPSKVTPDIRVAAAVATTDGGVWDRLAQCESGGRWNVNTGNGYYGGLQFNISTWGGFGGYSTADLAPKEVQIAKAEQIRARRGFSPWPACARKLGLL